MNQESKGIQKQRQIMQKEFKKKDRLQKMRRKKNEMQQQNREDENRAGHLIV